MKIRFDPARLSPFLSGLFRLWVRTLRFECVGDADAFLKLNAEGQPVIIALWHGEIFPVTGFGHTLTNHLVTFVSQSKDGEVIARVLEDLGHVTVRGSSSKGGVRALLKAKRIMDRDNRMGVFTVDGPRGPRHKAKPGIIFLAQRAGALIVPMRGYPRWSKVFGSWDKFVLPLPFSRCRVYVGEPYKVTEEKLEKDVLEREQEKLEKRLLSLRPQE